MHPALLTPFAAKQTIGMAGVVMLWVGLIAAVLTLLGYALALRRPESRKSVWFGRLAYALTALSVLSVFGILGSIVYNRQYQFDYAFSHTGNDLHGWYRFAATWAGQEGSFLLWAAWTSVIGFLVLAKAGKYEARVMPFYVTILAFLCAILIKQSPFTIIPPPSVADLAANPTWHYPPLNGQGLNPSLVNYWMTIHPPTIFFGFASLAVPFCYAIAALIWKDYDGWLRRVMPYSLLSCAVLGIGLFMGGYWAYETQGWHGFWAWDPVENASFFPWLAITGLVHGSVVQKSRGGMVRTNTFLGLLAFWLFLLGTFLTRSGALASKGADGQLLSVHAFDNIGKSALSLMVAMLVGYGILGLTLWLLRLRSMPSGKKPIESPLSRDFAFVLAILLMVCACVVVTLGTTTPLISGWMHRTPFAPPPKFYNIVLLPLTMLAAFLIGCIPWLAWRKTDPDTFLRKLLVPWLIMLAFGFFMVIWVLGAQRNLAASFAAADSSDMVMKETLRAWINPSVQRMAVVSLASLGFLAAISNAILAYRVLRKKPLAAGGWIAHVGIGVLIIGIIVSNTYERTERFTLVQGGPSVEKFGYQFAFERMTGKPLDARPLNPDYDRNNAVQLRITPPAGETSSDGGPKTFVVSPRWFVYNLDQAADESKLDRMRWPSITRYWGHDLYIGFANDPAYQLPAVTLRPMQHQQVGPYDLFYFREIGEPQKFFATQLFIKTEDGKVIQAHPGKQFTENGPVDTDMAIPELRDENGVPGAIYLKRLDAATKVATLLVNLPGETGQWTVPLEVTFKPWINLVWAGVLITTMGTLLAMLRRIVEGRKSSRSGGKDEEPEEWELEAGLAPGGAGALVAPIIELPDDRKLVPTSVRRSRKPKPSPS